MAGVPRKPSPPQLDTEWERAALLPFEKGNLGGIRPALPQAVLDILSALALPGDVMQGNVDVNSPEVLQRAAAFPLEVSMPGMAAGASKALADGIDPNLLSIFAGPNSKTADKAAMKEAYDRAIFAAKMNSLVGKTGVPDRENDKIFEKTGWFVGPDGKMRYEIPDADIMGIGNFPRIDDEFARTVQEYKKTYPQANYFRMAQTMAPEANAGNTYLGQNPETVGSLISHPELFAAYPDLADVPMRLRGAPIAASEGEHIPMQGGKERIFAQAPSENELLSVIVHELQHGVQDREKFASGGNPEWTGQMLAQIAPGAQEQLSLPNPYNLYKALTGEVEARAVQSRFENGLMVKESPDLISDVGESVRRAILGEFTPYTRVPGLPAVEAGAYDTPFPLMIDPADLAQAASNAKDNPTKTAMLQKLLRIKSAMEPK